MQKLNIVDKTFISITFAEERTFQYNLINQIAEPYRQYQETITFAEADASHLISPQKKDKPEVCEIGDIDCFSRRNI